MRKFINLIESVGNEEITDQSLLSDVYEIVNEYVTFGEMRTPNQFDNKLSRLMDMIPRPQHGELLYRVLRLTDEQRTEFEAGKLVLHNRKFSSWTNSKDSAILLAMIRGDNTLIISHEFTADHIVIDVKEFYDEHEFNSFHHDEYHDYIVHENEVIVYDSGEMKIDSSNSYIFQSKHIDPPMIGDKAYFGQNDEDGLEIEDVDYDQPYSGRGIFYVTLSSGDETRVRNIGPNEWETVTLGMSA